MSASPAQVLKAAMVAANVCSEHNGTPWPCFVNSMPDKPDVAMAVIDRGAEKQGRILRTGEVIEKPIVQIQFRSKTYTEGWTQAAAVKAWVDGLYALPVTVGSESYIIHSIRRDNSVLPLGAEPETSSRRELFTLNILLTLRQT